MVQKKVLTYRTLKTQNAIQYLLRILVRPNSLSLLSPFTDFPVILSASRGGGGVGAATLWHVILVLHSYVKYGTYLMIIGLIRSLYDRIVVRR